jgi:hypothetical protein
MGRTSSARITLQYHRESFEGFMPESNGSVDLPTPVPIAFLLCDQVSADSTTGKKTVVGIFDRIGANRFPAIHRSATLFAKLIDCEGEYETKVEFVQVAQEKVLAVVNGKLQGRDRHEYLEFSIQIQAFSIPEPGQYEFRLWMNNRYIHRIRFSAQVQAESGASQ